MADKDNNNQQNQKNEGDDAVQPSKRLRINEQCEFIANNNTTADQDSNQASSEEEEEICSLCMEPATADCPILPEHQCPQCAKDAWKICQTCNESLLSRTCPVCRGDYAPIVMHTVPGKC
jgi:hypothetical protein